MRKLKALLQLIIRRLEAESGRWKERRATKAPPDIKMILWFLQEAENAFFWCIKLQATTKKVVPCAPLCRAERRGNIVRIGKAKQKFACRKMRLKYIGLWMLLEFKAKASARGDVVTAERLGASKSKAAYSSKLAIDGEFFEENANSCFKVFAESWRCKYQNIIRKTGFKFLIFPTLMWSLNSLLAPCVSRD